MAASKSAGALAVGAACGLAALSLVSCGERSEPGPAPDAGASDAERAAPAEAPVAAPVDGPAPAQDLIDRLGAALIRSTAPASGDDVGARDAAGERLMRIGDLVDAGDPFVLWGRYEEGKGYDPENYRLMALVPEALGRLYLSCFVFSGSPLRSEQDGFTVVEVPARFRGGLPDGDYPHALWFTEESWRGYADTASVALVFEGERLVAALYKPGETGADAAPAREWNKEWSWTDAGGAAQPRVAGFDYLFSAENPHLRKLTEAYGALVPFFESEHCMKCHAPDNRVKAEVLTVLVHPAQALAARAALVEVLEKNSMPPRDRERGWEEGIRDETVRAAMLEAAKRFREEGDFALSYEGVKLERPEEWSAPRLSE